MQSETGLEENVLQYFQERSRSLLEHIEREFGREVVDYISEYANMTDPNTEALLTAEQFNVAVINSRTLSTLINLKRINDISSPNDFLGLVNQKLNEGGYFICCAETLASRRRRIFNKYPGILSYPFYFGDFLIKRVFPKIMLTKRISSILTRGINRVMSNTEIMGRLVACGFSIVDSRQIGYLTYYVCKKEKAPVYCSEDNCGLLIKLKRIGQGGKLIDVYKFRTMHPYAEYLQDYVYQNNDFEEGCKFKGDFRITSWGRVMRKLWIDEQPMWINWLKREMKLVGIRPLSEHFFMLYPEEMQKRRIKYRPGLIPPFYADMPKTLEEIVASEKNYLDAYEKCPFWTDLRYFCRSFFNIIIKRSRSA